MWLCSGTYSRVAGISRFARQAGVMSYLLFWTAMIGTSDVIEQQVVVELKQLAQTLLKMLLQDRLVRQYTIQRPIETILVDLLRRYSQ